MQQDDQGGQVIKVKCAPVEWPLFSAPGLSSMRVVDYKEKGGILYFSVLAVLEGFKWKIDRTYEEFMELQRTLTRLYGMDYPALPSYKKMFGFSLFSSTKPDQAEEMRKKLESFAMSAVTSFPVPPTELLKFVEYPFTDVLSVTQALAKFFYVEGEIVLSNDKAVQMSPLQLHCINKRMTLPLASSGKESGKMKDDFGHLLDFLQNLKKLKIAPPTDEHAVANVDTMTFDLNLMKSLEVLLIESVQVGQLEARYSLPKQLVKLEVRRSLKLLQEILVVYPSSDVDHSPVSMPPLFSSTQAPDFGQAMHWEKLQQANFKLNGIIRIDESVKLLSALERLDLSFNYIEEIQHLVELPHLRVLDLSHNKITCLSDLHTRLGNITKLGLQSNNIVKLNGIQKMFSIQYLDLSNNQISDVSEVHCLDPLPCLEKLFLKGNPVCQSLSYRSQVFSNLPQFAEQVALDGKPPTQDELMVSISTPTTGHKRVPSRTPDIRPDIEDLPAPEELEVGIDGGMTSQLEKLRLEGGDRWLSILNAEKAKDDSEVVAAKSPKNPKKKKARHTHHGHSHHSHSHKTKKHAEPQMAPQLDVSESALSFQLAELLKTTQEEHLPSTVSFEVTVLEYRNSAFLSLSPGDLDQLLQNNAMEECAFSIDTLIGKALEIDLAAGGTRVTRDLRLIHHMKIHEGKRLAVCLQLPSSRSSSLGGSRWLIYSVQHIRELARMYCALKKSMTRSKSVSPDRPLLEILNSIQSDASGSSLPSSGSPSIRHLSESNSHAGDQSHFIPVSSSVEVNGTDIGTAGSQVSLGGSDTNSKIRLEASGDFESASYEDPAPSRRQNGVGGPAEVSSPPSLDSASVMSPTHEGAEGADVPMSISDSLSISLSSSAGVLSPQHHRGLESSASSQGEHQTEGVGSTDGPGARSGHRRSKSPGERRNVSSQPRDGSFELPAKTSSRAPSAASSRGGSGTSTPKSQKKGLVATAWAIATGRSSRQSTPPRQPPQDLPAAVCARLEESGAAAANVGRSSANGRGTPPVSGKPQPQNIPVAISRKLETIASPPDLTLPSPLYSKGGVGKSKALEDDEEEGEEDLCHEVQGLYDPVVPSGEHTDARVIEEAVKLSGSESAGVARRRGRQEPKLSTSRSIVTKPGLDDNNLRLFFKNIIADDTSEILMNITWGVCNLPSAPSCEIEVGTIISDRGIYLLEVLDPDNHKSRPLSWTSENFPLAKITCCYHPTLRKLVIGIFDQSLTIESFEKGLVKRFVFFPHTYEKLNLFVENLKAACDAHRIPYTVTSFEQGFLASSGNAFLILNPGSDDLAKLKENLVWSESRAQVGNAMALSTKSTESTESLTGSYEFEVSKVSSESVKKFDIVQYVIVGELSSDILPISDGKLHVQSRALILTNDMIYVCKEELDSWPRESTSIRAPPFPKCNVLDAHPISRVSGVRVCDKSHFVVSCTDPLYEFAISFEELDDIQLSPTLSAEWVLCVHDRQYLDQLLNCLIHLSNELQKENQKLVTIKHTSNQLVTPCLPKPPRVEKSDSFSSRKDVGSKRNSSSGVTSYRGTNPCFFSSSVLFEFAIFTNYQRLKFFKKHIAQAEFMKSDEIPLSVFLAHCSTAPSEYVEVEACVLVSNYAIYLLSDVDNIQQWVEMGGVSSFQRKDLLDRKNADQIRAFYRLWLKEIRQVDVGVFYDCISIADTKEESRFTIHTENPSATLSFLSALSCVVDLHDTVEEKAMDTILSDYDLVIDTIPADAKKVKESQGLHYVEFVYHGEEQVSTLKRAMVGISPAIAKGVRNQESANTVKILYQQVVLLVEELRIRDLLTSRFYPHLIFLTNYGIYVCRNEASEKCSPSVMNPSKLSVKKWCHIDLLERLHVTSPSTSHYSSYNVVIHLRTANRAVLSSEDSASSLSLLIQNSELLGSFLHHFSLMYQEHSGKQITITRD